MKSEQKYYTANMRHSMSNSTSDIDNFTSTRKLYSHTGKNQLNLRHLIEQYQLNEKNSFIVTVTIILA